MTRRLSPAEFEANLREALRDHEPFGAALAIGVGTTVREHVVVREPWVFRDGAIDVAATVENLVPRALRVAYEDEA